MSVPFDQEEIMLLDPSRQSWFVWDYSFLIEGGDGETTSGEDNFWRTNENAFDAWSFYFTQYAGGGDTWDYFESKEWGHSITMYQVPETIPEGLEEYEMTLFADIYPDTWDIAESHDYQSNNPDMRLQIDYMGAVDSNLPESFWPQFVGPNQLPFQPVGYYPIQGFPQDWEWHPIAIPLTIPGPLNPGQVITLRWQVLPYPLNTIPYEPGDNIDATQSFAYIYIRAPNASPGVNPKILLRWGEEVEEETLKPILQRRAKRMRDRYQAMTGTLTGRRR